MEFEYDPIVQRPEPEREVLVRAHAYMRRTETPMEQYLRQQWQAAMSATRVALDAWRSVWPIEVEGNLDDDEQKTAGYIMAALEQSYQRLDSLSRRMLGDVMYSAQLGQMTEEWLDDVEHDD